MQQKNCILQIGLICFLKKSRESKQNSDAPKGFYKADNTTPNDVIVLESKQNSDAAGLLYQWGRKDPFTFATKATGVTGYNGLNPLKIYNAQGKEIVQTLNGDTDTNGAITIVTETASSMLETVRKPNTYYGKNYILINQSGLTRDIWDYYWTSYSRGTDGQSEWNIINPNWNNTYLDGYNQKRPKSIFDPCPYGFRLPVNGVWNKFPKSVFSWMSGSYIGGTNWLNSWNIALGWRTNLGFEYVSAHGFIQTATINSITGSYVITFIRNSQVWNNHTYSKSYGFSLRCIEDVIMAVHNY